jgi:GntR family transcriptional regulator of arabinose operon
MSHDQAKPKYREICDEIRADIESGRYSTGNRLPSDAELATRFSTSRLTVIRALRDLESEGSVRRKAGSGTFVSRARVTAASYSFGILMPDLGDGEVFEPISRAIARAGESAQHRILWGSSSPPDAGKEEYAIALCRYFVSHRVAGVFFAPIELSSNQDEVNEMIVAELERANIQVVLIDRCFRPFPERSSYDLIGIDNRRAGYRMTRHLLEVGRKRLSFACRTGSAPTVSARLAGFHEALSSFCGAELCSNFETDVSNEGQLAEFIRRESPEGFVCANDLTAAKLMHDLLNLGVRVPEQIGMVGINDVKYARFLPVPLTTLRQPCTEIGAAAMSTMLQRIARPESPAYDVLLDCELVVRQSCGKENARSAASGSTSAAG